MNPVQIERLYQVLDRPHITEKATRIADAHNQIVFRTVASASKAEIRSAVEMIFNVKVERVQTLKQKSKIKRRGAQVGVRSGWKKAIVTVKKGQEVNFSGEIATPEQTQKA